MAGNVGHVAVARLRQLLVISVIVTGLVLIGTSFLVKTPTAQAILLGLGLTLAPGGVVSFLLARYGTDILEALLRDRIEQTLRDSLSKDMELIRSSVEKQVAHLEAVVERGVAGVEKRLNRISPLFVATTKLGVENMHLTRGIALSQFAWFLDTEAQRAERGEQGSKIWIVSSSAKGFLEATSEHFDGKRMMQRFARCGCDLRILMTDPAVADFRAKQEQRADGEIAQEVLMNVAYLKRIGVRRESIRFYSGAPTVFAVATTDHMLLNPYPYRTEAFRCFSMIVRRTQEPEADIFHQYLIYHFEEPWERATEVESNLWDRC